MQVIGSQMLRILFVILFFWLSSAEEISKVNGREYIKYGLIKPFFLKVETGIGLDDSSERTIDFRTKRVPAVSMTKLAK